ncbi:ATP-binding cassette domain-containing protein [Thermococcus waiotapuensis]|uniref:ATP-binding cassette domain-containing protein n=1 Tax=Thermococcus waiotapuensis TaxID=90909 RepID=A0AAE4NUM3_9EURY|nr:ATP-binding cassette domain-containing protein [Thermococcus waiotapuensis]MDV3103900.1 ATP-binding cassette domain-containing protein [Thermococcus waiotapuensis]
MGEALVLVRNLEKSFSGEKILGGITLEANRGEVVGIVGPNGTGKSTLVKILAGVERPDSGEALVRGKLSLVYQEDYLLPWKRLRDNLCLGLRFRGGDCDSLPIAKRLMIDRFLDKYPKEVSGGTRRKAAIARALLFDFDVLILDEPLTGLDTESKDTLLSIIEELAESGKAVLIVSHQLEELFRVAHRVYVLNGRPAIVTKVLRKEELGKGAV